MKLIVLGVVLVAALTYSLPQPGQDLQAWNRFKVTHKKVYSGEEEENRRHSIFLNNLRFIEEHNKKYDDGRSSFYLGVNQFADMTHEEFKDHFIGKYNHKKGKGKIFSKNSDVEVKWSIDWRDEGAVTPVRNQLQCASFWAISATGSIEGQLFLKTKQLVPLSIQNLIDCSIAQGNKACFGGNVDKAFDYVIKNKGIASEVLYPYTGYTGYYCHYKTSMNVTSISSYVDVTSESEGDLRYAVSEVGPVSVALDASLPSFQFYQGGLYSDDNCSSSALNHAALVVGYGMSWSSGEYWIVKNSWGTSWGEEGYIKIARGHNNMCGIATAASYPVL